MKVNLYKIVDDLFDFIEAVADSKRRVYLYAFGRMPRNRLAETTYYYNLRKFQKHGLIKKVRKNKRIVYEITKRAKQLRARPSVKEDRSDGFSTFVMFDIPEDKHKVRDTFRRYLIRNRYTQIQKSVFISPFKAFQELIELTKELELEHNVIFISGKINRILQ